MKLNSIAKIFQLPKKWYACIAIAILALGTTAYFGFREIPDDPNAPHPRYDPQKAGALVNVPVEDPPLKRVADIIPADYLDDDELVLGVTVDGESRAYPLGQLSGNKRQIINDVLGDRPIMVTW